METEKKLSNDHGKIEEKEEAEALELVLFHVSECYVYLIPPRKSAASYRADEWDVNKWAWEGALKVISKGEECIIRLEDKKSGELYAQAFLRKGEQHPVEPVIDSSRYFVLRVEEDIGGRHRHAFIGIGFRERTEAYDFQAALHDHMKYLDKKQTAEEMEQHFQKTSSVDYSLKEGETLVLQIKNKNSGSAKTKISEQVLSNLLVEEKGNRKEPVLSIKPPPPPAAPVSPTTSQRSPFNLSPPPVAHTSSSSSDQASSKSPQNLELKEGFKDGAHSEQEIEIEELHASENKSSQHAPDDDFGDFQMAG